MTLKRGERRKQGCICFVKLLTLCAFQPEVQGGPFEDSEPQEVIEAQMRTAAKRAMDDEGRTKENSARRRLAFD